MSTRGHVAIKENGKYKYIYSHHDGLGITFYRHYRDANEIRELGTLGNTSSIEITVEEGGRKTYREHLSNLLKERGTVAAFRDINRWGKSKWNKAYWNDGNYLRDLEDVLHSKNLLEKLFSDMYKKAHLPGFYEKCLKA